MSKGILFALVFCLTACGGNKLTVKDETALAEFGAELAVCETQPDAGGCITDAQKAFDAAKNDAGAF